MGEKPRLVEELESRVLLAYSTVTTLSFNAAAGGINGTGFTATLPTSKGTGLISGNVTMGNGQLRLNSTAGDAWQTRNTQDDALNLPINGAADFEVEARLTSFPFTKNWQNAGIFVGTNEDNYVKLVGGFSGQTMLQLGSETGAVFSTPAFKNITVGSFTSLDLRLTGNATTKAITAAYRLNSDLESGWVTLGSASNASVFSANAKAGVISTNFGGTPVITSYNWFIERHTPTVTPPPPPPPPAGNVTSIALDFNGGSGGLNDTGFTTVLASSKGTAQIGGNFSVSGGKLNLVTTAGDLWQTRNNQANALSVPTDVSARDFTVQSRLTSFPTTKNYQNAGIFVGPNEDNFVKLVVGYAGGTSIQLGSEAGAVFGTPAFAALNLAGITSLDLRLQGTYADKKLVASYRVNSSSDSDWVSVGSTTNASVFSASARTGVVATSFGATPITIGYDSFTLADGVTNPPPPPPPPPTGGVPITIGTNLDGIAEFSPIAPFIDLAVMFRPWGNTSTPYQTDPSIPLTADNYPLANAGTITYATAYPDGDYQVSYEGQATLAFSGLGAAWTVTSTAGGVTRGVLRINPQSNPGTLTMYVTNVSASNPLKNLHIISPDANLAVSDTYRPVFLQKLGIFDGFLRMMDWMQANENPIQHWADRTGPGRFSYVNAMGVPYEAIAKLANDAQKDVWINIPVMADDDFIHKIAQLFRDQMNAGRKVYVEYSNELWAYWAHKDAKWNLEHAKADPAITKTDPWGQSAQGTGKRLVEIASIFKQEFGATRYANQVRPMLGALVAGSSWGEIALEFIRDKYGPVSNYVSGLAIGDYVGVINDFAPVDDANLTLDKLFSWANNWIDTQLADWVKANKAVADKFGIPLHSYEGGQAFVASNGMNEALKRQAQDDPRMGDLYKHLVRSWFSIAGSGSIWGNFATANKYTQYGYWGVLQSILQTTSVKYEAIKQLATESL